MQQKARVVLIDEIRGLCVFFMVLYHGMYDLNMTILDSEFVEFLRDFFAGIFVLISGLSCNFSKNNLTRGTKCFVLAMGLSLITYILSPDMYIVWGILHMLGFSMMFYALLKNIFKNIFKHILNKNIKYIFLICFLGLFFLTFDIHKGYIKIFDFVFWAPQYFYEQDFLFWVGFPSKDFCSSDYFPLLPWMFLFLFGALLGSLKDQAEYPDLMFRKRSRILGLMGQKSLIIYLLHQPLLYGLLYITRNIFYIK